MPLKHTHVCMHTHTHVHAHTHTLKSIKTCRLYTMTHLGMSGITTREAERGYQVLLHSFKNLDGKYLLHKSVWHRAITQTTNRLLILYISHFKLCLPRYLYENFKDIKQYRKNLLEVTSTSIGKMSNCFSGLWLVFIRMNAVWLFSVRPTKFAFIIVLVSYGGISWNQSER